MSTMTMTPAFRNFELPWSPSREQDRRFHNILLYALAALMMLTGLMLVLPVPPLPILAPPPERPVEMLPLPVPPPPPEVKPEPVPEQPIPKPVTPKPQPVQEKPQPPKPNARDKAKEQLDQVADELDALRDLQTDVSDAKTAVIGTPGDGVKSERSLITSRVGQASGGINTQSLSRGTGGSGLGNRNTTKVDSPVAGAVAGGKNGAPGAKGPNSRSREEVELVFDRNKGALFALYNRALRETPGLQGKVVLRLTILPNGTISECDIVSSELGNADLERKIVLRVKQFHFEARDVAPVTTTKPIDFFPA